MWTSKRTNNTRIEEFFLVGLSHDSLENYYQVNFAMMQHHNYSLTEIESLLPWERQVYIALLINHVKEENDKIKERNMRR